MSVNSAPYRVRLTDPNGATDVHLILVTDLGGNSVVSGIYVTTDGITGLQPASVVVNAGVVDEWQDYRGNVGFAPKITFTGTQKPAWDGTNKIITSDGIDDEGSSIASALFDISGAKGFVVVASHVSGTYIAAISNGAYTRNMAFYKDPTNWSIHVEALYPGANSGVVADSTRRVVIASKNASTTSKIIVPNQSQVTVSPAASAAGDNSITAFRAAAGFGPGGSSVVIRALIVLNFDPDVTQRNIIRDWAIANHAAVAA